MDTLLTNGYVVTVDPERRVIPRGWISIKNDLISGLGEMRDLPDGEFDEVINLGEKLVMPGLVNGHTHHWGSFFKNTGEGLLLEDWINQVAMPLARTLSGEDLRVAAYLSAAEQLRTGTTCSLNHVTNVNDEAAIAATVEPVVEIGARQLVTKELRHAPDPPFSDRYPAVANSRSLDEEVSFASSIIDRWDGTAGRIHMGLALDTGAHFMLHNLISPELILAGVELANAKDIRLTNHCSAGTPWLSIKEFEDETGGGEIDYLAGLGAMTGNWVLAHSLHLKNRELEVIAAAGAGIISAPVSNAFSCDGIAPLEEMFKLGIAVGLGTDGGYCNCTADMVETMKFACLIQNVTHYDPNLVTAERAIEMATIGSATVMGLADMIGSLEPDKKADIVVFDLAKTHHTVLNRPVAGLVFSGRGTDADLVMVDGRILLRDGVLLTLPNEAEVLAEANMRAHAALERIGLNKRVSVHWRSSAVI